MSGKQEISAPFPDAKLRTAPVEEWDHEAPLTRAKGESKISWAALQDYFYMGDHRALRALWRRYTEQALAGNRPPTRRLATIISWSRWHLWTERVNAQKDIDNAKDKAKWEEYREQVREQEWQGATRLYQLANLILDESPKFLKTTKRVIPAKYEQGIQVEPEREIITIALNADLALKSLEAFSKLSRNAAGMHAQSFSMDIDLSTLSDDQVERIANGEDPLRVLADGPASVAEQLFGAKVQAPKEKDGESSG